MTVSDCPRMIAPGRIIIVHAMLHGVRDHFCSLRFVDRRRVAACGGQAHTSHAQHGEPLSLEFTMGHM